MKTIYTIGYEGADLSDFIETLIEAGVEHILDVRELPQSRRRGFSKNVLADALSGHGIGYSHAKQLGDPKHGREAARRGDMNQFKMIFEAHLDLPVTQVALNEAASLLAGKPTALLCYERNPKECHRTLVAQRLIGLGSFQVQHLGVRHNVSRRPLLTTQTAVGYA